VFKQIDLPEPMRNSLCVRVYINRYTVLLVFQHRYLVGVQNYSPLCLFNTIQLNQLVAEVLT